MEEFETITEESTSLASFTIAVTSTWRFYFATLITVKTRWKVALVAAITWNRPLWIDNIDIIIHRLTSAMYQPSFPKEIQAAAEMVKVKVHQFWNKTVTLAYIEHNHKSVKFVSKAQVKLVIDTMMTDTWDADQPSVCAIIILEIAKALQSQSAKKKNPSK